MSDLTPREKVARPLLVIAALEKLSDSEKVKFRAEAKEAFTLPGQREVAELNGVILGNVRLDPAPEGWKVTDSEAFLDWVTEHFAFNLVTRTVVTVAPSFEKRLLDQLGDGIEICDPATGECFAAVPGVTYVKGEPKLVVTPSKEAPAAVRAALGGSLPGIEAS